MPHLAVKAKGAGERPVLVLTGELDIATVDQLRAAAGEVLSATGRSLELDLSQVTFLDSSGLGVLVELRNLLRERGGSLTVGAASRPAIRVIELAGLAAALGLPGAPADN
jgi:anti-sigma B factor antagonist